MAATKTPSRRRNRIRGPPGNSQLAEYVNDQAATHLFYHDHAMSVTALNVMAGLFGNYVIRDDEEDPLELPRGR